MPVIGSIAGVSGTTNYRSVTVRPTIPSTDTTNYAIFYSSTLSTGTTSVATFSTTTNNNQSFSIRVSPAAIVIKDYTSNYEISNENITALIFISGTDSVTVIQKDDNGEIISQIIPNTSSASVNLYNNPIFTSSGLNPEAVVTFDIARNFSSYGNVDFANGNTNYTFDYASGNPAKAYVTLGDLAEGGTVYIDVQDRPSIVIVDSPKNNVTLGTTVYNAPVSRQWNVAPYNNGERRQNNLTVTANPDPTITVNYTNTSAPVITDTEG